MGKPKPRDGELHVSLHGPDVQLNDVVETAEATKKLLAAVAEGMGVEGVTWKVGDIRFICDGCGRAGPFDSAERQRLGWTNDGMNDHCPDCPELVRGER